jgi:4-oxalocrotonate tautomerase
MPLVRISVYDSTPSNQRKAIAEAVYEAMRQTIDISDGDRFIVRGWCIEPLSSRWCRRR